MAMSIQAPARSGLRRAVGAFLVRGLLRLRAAMVGKPPALETLSLPDHWLRDLGLEKEAHSRRASEAADDWRRFDRW